jgi:energy-coupling factor transporter ATP-binding protein EcfA2
MTQFTIGPRTQNQFTRLSREWKQGEHVIVSGGTGSGKTLLGRYLDQIRIDAGGAVIVFVCKLSPDPTIMQEYKGFRRWDKFKTRGLRPDDNKILLWPDTDKAKTVQEARDIQRDVFKDAVNKLAKTGKWTVDFDEGLYMTNPAFMNMADDIAMLHALGRSSKLTIITKTQRPSHLPLIIYGSASHAFVGRTREASDVKRLAELGGKISAKEMAANISSQGRHDFLWIPVAPDWDPETVNLEK